MTKPVPQSSFLYRLLFTSGISCPFCSAPCSVCPADGGVYSFTFNPSLLTIPKRKQQVAEILKEAETYIWRIKEEMRCA